MIALEPGAGPFAMDVLRTSPVLTVHLSGTLDLESSGYADEAIEQIDPSVSTVILETSRLGFCDSSGLVGFTRIVIRAREVGATVAVHHASEALRQLIVVTGLDQILTVTDD